MSATTGQRPNTIEEVTIGTQTWMAKNYDFEGDSPDDDFDNVTVYGKLYTWDEAVEIAAGIDGWHLPSGTECNTLGTYLGGLTIAGGHLKEAGLDHWTTPNTSADNSSGFTAVPAGWRTDAGVYELFGLYSIFWTNDESGTDGGFCQFAYNSAALAQGQMDKDYKVSVRLIKD